MSELALELIAENKRTKAKTLDLGNCDLTEVPEEVGDLVWLEELIFSNTWYEYNVEKKQWTTKRSQNKKKNNNITFLPPFLSQLQILEKLVIASMQIFDLSPIANLYSLRQLSCSSTRVADLSPISNLVNLQRLSCSSTRVADLSPISNLVNLQQLSCSSTQILDLSPISNLVNLQQLSCSSTQVLDLSPIANLVNLQQLSCYSTQVLDLSPIANLVNLQNFSCHSTKVFDLLPIANLSNLQQVNCRNTQVSDLSPMANLSNLQQVNCRNTQVSDLSPMANLSNLQKLDCSSTQISDLSPIANLVELQYLSCQGTKISDLSPITNLVKLQQINCYLTKIFDLLPISNLVNLQQFSCFLTKVSDLSPVANLINLQKLNCQSTRVLDLSPIVDLIYLQQIECQNTNIFDLSPIANLVNLQKLNCNSTKVSDLSPLTNLVNLQKLDCGNTKVSDLSPVANLINLQKLDCGNTQVSDLSPVIPLIKKGKQVKWNNKGDIRIGGCPLTFPPVEIVRKGNKAIIKYFEELEIAKKAGLVIRLAEAKCLILGEGGAGKTSLTRKLLNRENPLPKEQETTKGINVHSHDLKLLDGTDFRLNIWDFGGQEIYHATHQFFLTKRSLYVLLDDTRKDEKTVNDPSFNYWLQVAELYGGGSPLLIVQNEKGDRSKELDLRGMQERFGFVKDAKSTNLLTCRGLDKVWEAIEFWVKQLPHIGEEQPKAWIDIRRELERLATVSNRDYISLEEYYQICAQYTIIERERALFLSSYLHDFGVFLHFQEHPLLRKILVLNNQWATDAVYKVLDCEAVKHAFGRFTRYDLATIWVDDRYADQHEELLALMEKFELCYKLPDQKTETWLAPQLLSVLQPDALRWDEVDNLQVRYEYEFMPKGLLSQHIVRMQRYVRQPELAWKSGVVFEREGSQTLVTEAWGSRKISLRARGIQAKELLTLLSEDFDNMHSRLEGLKAKKMIPCNCRICCKVLEPHFYDYEDLATRKERGKPTVECRVSYEDVSVLGLLDGIFTKVVEKKQKEKQHRLKTVKIFLASSSELLDDRDQFEIFIYRENKHLIDKGIFLELVRWEDFLDTISATGLQNEYNKVLRTCDIVVCLFFTKIGKYTAEEFDTALGQFRSTGKPRIYTYFKDVHVKPSALRDFQSVVEFKHKLDNLGYFPNHYETFGDLKQHFGEQIKKLGVENDLMTKFRSL